SIFFFSRRRRHTIFSRDWSSDVCSSVLQHEFAENLLSALALPAAFRFPAGGEQPVEREELFRRRQDQQMIAGFQFLDPGAVDQQLGGAARRGRGRRGGGEIWGDNDRFEH